MARLATMAAVALLVASVRADVDEKDVIVLTEKNFDSIVPESELVLVEFYAPWCGHCKKLTPEYAKAATTLASHDPPIKLAKVDATEEGGLASKYGVNGYPTLKVFRKGDASDYNGPREAAGIVKYMKSQSGPSSIELTSVEQAEKVTSGYLVIVGFFPTDNAASNSFQQAANMLREDFKFAHTSNADVIKKLGGAADDIIMFKSYDEKKLAFTGAASISKASIEDWIIKNNLPLGGVYTPDNKDLYRRQGKPLVRVLSDIDVSKNEKQAKYFGNRLRKAAKAHPELAFAVSFKTDFPADNEAFGLSAGDVDPVVLEDFKNDAKYKAPAGKFTADAVKAFAAAFEAGSLKPWVKSEPVPPKAGKGEVAVVVGETFNDIVLDKSKDVLIEFYAPWCGHCKSLEPKYNELAKSLEHVESLVIAKLDATANDIPHPSYEARGYPTIVFAPANNKDSPIKYEGEREVAAFKKWLKKKASIPFPKKQK